LQRRAAQAAELSAPGPEQRPAPDDRGSPRPSIGQRFRKLLAGSGIVLIVAGAVHLGINVYESYAPSGVSNAALLSRQESKPEEKKMARAENRGAVAPVKPLTADPQTTASIAAPRAAAPAAAPSPEPILVPSDKFPQALRSAALSGDAVAAYEIAMRHLDGRGVPVSVEEAARWFQRAAKAGLAPAQFWLGSLYEKGQGVKRNTEAARGLYVAAAEKGNAKAMHNLAVLYAEGGLGKPDYATAAEWFRKAAEHGVADSQYNLGILYARGVGVEQNLSESYKWFALAAATGDKDAGKKRDEIGKRLDPAALSAARQAADSFVAKRQPAEATTVQPPPGGWDAPTANARTPKGAQAVIVNRS
jgi:localization factor PodJL